MRPRFRSSSLVPTGFVIDHLNVDADRIDMVVRSGAAVAFCPDCRTSSRRIQSRYQRRAADLPLGGRRVELRVVVGRFWCDAAACTEATHRRSRDRADRLQLDYALSPTPERRAASSGRRAGRVRGPTRPPCSSPRTSAGRDRRGRDR